MRSVADHVAYLAAISFSHGGADAGYVGSVPQSQGTLSPVVPSGCGCCSTHASGVSASLEGPEPCPASDIPVFTAEGVLAEAKQPARAVAAVDGAVTG